MRQTHKTLKGLFCLDHNIKLYIPSTVDVDKSIDNTEYVNLTLAKFGEWFGGATSYDATGAWLSQDKGLITEAVKIVESYATKEACIESLDKVIKLAEELKSKLNQEAISLEYDNKLYFI